MTDLLQVRLVYAFTDPRAEIMLGTGCGFIPERMINSLQLSVALVAPYLSFYHIYLIHSRFYANSDNGVGFQYRSRSTGKPKGPRSCSNSSKLK